MGQFHNEFMGKRCLGSLYHFFLGSIRLAKENICLYGIVEKNNVLCNRSDVSPEGMERKAPYIPAVYIKAPPGRIPKTGYEVDERALSRTAVSHKGNDLAGPHMQINAAQRIVVGQRISEGNVVENNVALYNYIFTVLFLRFG